MIDDFPTNIKGHTLEFFADTHTYLVNGLIVPSITQVLKAKFGHKYDGVGKAVLAGAAKAGTAVHDALDRYAKTGEESDLPEVRNFKFLQKKFGFFVVASEQPVILFSDEKPIAAGRPDMVLRMCDKIGGADIKRTATLDKEYLAYQLNLYRIAYRQCYGFEWEFLRGIYLRGEKRKFVDIPINENLAWSIIREYMEGGNGI